MVLDKLKEFEPIFHPRSIAVVGASADSRSMGYIYTNNLSEAGFRGNIYPVNPRREEVLGLKCYPNLRAIPGDVDYVISCIPKEFVLDLMDDCAAKGVRVVQLFTAGFRESGEEGLSQEEEMVRRARQGGFRILGPNCIGVYCSSSNMSFGTSRLLMERGEVACISQSGGLAIRLVRMAQEQGVRFSKVVSYGNACDLDALDFLEYLALDPETRVIGAYIEGLREGGRFLSLVRRIASTKPIVVWKGGRSEVGARTAAAHTGALTSPGAIWAAALRQAGAIGVGSLEELVDSLLAFQCIPGWAGSRVAVITGFGGGGGGPAVSAADICIGMGLQVHPFSEDTQERLKPFVSPVGSIRHNPLDFNSAAGTPEDVYQALSLVAADPNVDFLLFDGYMLLLGALPAETVRMVQQQIIDIRRRQGKPVVMLLPLGFPRLREMGILEGFWEAGIPVYPSAGRAARAVLQLAQHHRHSLA